jgi:predicted DNA-binding protein
MNTTTETTTAPTWSMVSARWPRADADRLNRIAREHGLTRSAMIRTAVQAWLNTQRPCTAAQNHSSTRPQHDPR